MANLSDSFTTDTSATDWTPRAGVTWVHDAANNEADLVVSNPRYCVQYNTSPGSADHECQGTFQVGTSSSHGGAGVVAVRVNNGATKQWYYAACYPRDSIIQLLRRNNGTDSSGSSSTQLGIDQAFTVADGDWITVCLAAEGTTISLWFTNHGASPPVSDPAWLSEGGAAQYAQTDATYNHQYVGMAGNSSGNDYDTRVKWWKARLISDRPGSGTDYELACDGGSYTITGTAAALRAGRRLACNAGAFTVTGTAAALLTERTLTCTGGSVSVSGTAASLSLGRRLSCSAGSVAITGTAATLSTTRTLSCVSGSYSVTGTAATGRVDRRLTCASGAFAVSGTAAELKYGNILSAESGSVVITGTAATLRATRLLACQAGAFAFSGTAATLTVSGSGSINVRAAYRVAIPKDDFIVQVPSDDLRVLIPSRTT